MRFSAIVTPVVVAAAMAAAPVSAQTLRPAGTAEQRAAMDRLDHLDGEWVGPAWAIMPGSGRLDLTQTERVGDMLGGSIKVVEGRGYAADGSLAFNAFAIISWDEAKKAYNFRTYANGHATDYPLWATDDGFRWEMPAGPNAKVVYTAVIKDGLWTEVGEYVAEGQPPRKFVELTVRRRGDTAWPASGAVPPR